MTFERRVAVRYLAALLTGAARSEAEGWRVTMVGFQQGQAGPVDDLHVRMARDCEEPESLELRVAVRRSPSFTRSDADTGKLIGTFVEALGTPIEPGVERRLIVTVAGHQPSASELAELAELAKSMDAVAFAEEMATDGRPRRALKSRFEHVRDLVAAALPSDGDAAATTWQLLQRLYVSMPRLEPPDEADWTALLTELESWARDQTAAGADVLRAKLESLAASYSPLAAVVRHRQLARDAHAALRRDRRVGAAAREELRRLDREARDSVRLVCGTDGVRLPRDEALAALASALEDHPVLIVTGDSGTGKSALVRATVEQHEASEPEDFEAVVLNLRQLPRLPTELRSALGAPLERVLTEMHAPRRLLVLDGADVQAETDETPLDSLARSALEADVAVCIVAASEGRAAVEGVAARLGVNVARHEVVGLTDEEIDSLVEQIPALQRLANVPHSRELLRRPALADLLARAGGDDLPVSDSEAMDAVWAGLVRDHERTVRGTPDARDNVLRQLAANALEPGRVALAQLDAEALDGLKRDGVLHSSESTWSAAPSFTHDILRTYAVAKVLGEDTQPVGRLKRHNTPRWALPAMRLVVEKSLRSDGPAPRLTLQEVQHTFDELADSGAGLRWADVPWEAALGLPEARQLLAGSWDELIAEDGDGLKRILRVVDLRFRRSGILDRLVAQNLTALLLEHGWPDGANAEVTNFIEGWLLSLVVVPTPAGEGNRQRLRELILHRVSEGDRREREFAEEQAARLASRTAEEVAEAEARAAQFAAFSSIGFDEEDDDFDAPGRDLPGELTFESTVRCLAFLGPDLGSEGEALLRRVADRDPYRLAPALESPLASLAVAQYSPKLLADLTEAYYIKRRFRHDSLGDYGIRHHEPGGFGPLAGYHLGPFLALFHSDFIGGVGCLNRMLNHAARARMKVLGRHDPADAPDGLALDLNLTGSPGSYVGDGQTWLWYRGTGVGPYPCMSALQALEVVIDELIEEGRSTPEVLARFLLTDCSNLAMPALVYGMLARHLDSVTAAIDPFLSEPAVWHLEFGRVTSEHSGLAARGAPVTAPERRDWDPWRVAMVLALSADDVRGDELRAVGARLEVRALERGEDATTARRWAAALDRNSYDATQTDEGVVVQQREDPEVAEALEAQRADYTRFNQSLRLQSRYVDRFDQIRRPPPLVLEELTADVAVARDLLGSPPADGDRLFSEGPFATAAAALEGAYLDGLDVTLDDLLWSAEVLLKVVAERIGRTPNDVEDSQLYPHGADRSAARGLPLLLTPAAAEPRQALAASGATQIGTALTWLFTAAPIEVRIFASRALDAVWTSPCDGSHCHHRFAFDLVEDSVRHASVRRSSWNPEDNREPLSGPLLKALAAASEGVVAPDLSPALRALGAEARCSTCVHPEAADLLPAVLAAHRRSVKPFEHGYHQSESDALFAARAALTVAACGNTEPLLEHARDLAADAPHALQEFVEAIAAAAEEHLDLADTAREIWPQMMSDVLGLSARARAASENTFQDVGHRPSRIRRAFDRVRTSLRRDTPPPGRRGRVGAHSRWQDSALAALLPHMTYEHRHRYSELTSKPIRWPAPQQWRTEVDSWIDASDGGREAIDAMVHMLQTQPIEEQASIGIEWVERIVTKNPVDSKAFLLPEWLREVRSYCVEEELLSWQRVVDTLVIHGETRVRDLTD
ncbi:MAG: ATP-binding protein [Hyphomicrobiales bacterium]|nr:ATP-binding protein [Hyphomicrobiales bacterium]